MNNKNFALIGAAGYIAPRHMKAIKETENNLIAALDPSDSVGILVSNDLPDEAKAEKKVTYRTLSVDGEEFEFSGGFTDLHTLVYRDILDGRGFGLEDARAAINLVYELRNAKAIPINGEHSHSLVKNFRS